MSDNSRIEWTDATWNPVTGCTEVSPGCDHCYARTLTERFHGPGSFAQVTLHPDRLDQPLRWRRPRKVFVNSMSDLFHDDVPDHFIAAVFEVMGASPQHTFQILTKRHGRMRSLLKRWDEDGGWFRNAEGLVDYSAPPLDIGYTDLGIPRNWPLPNVWLGVSVENQQWADIRIPALLDTPAAVRFISAEPLLGPVNLDRLIRPAICSQCGGGWEGHACGPTHALLAHDRGVDWVIVGGESGPNARPMHPDWARSLRDQCEAAGVPFLFKQWGGRTPKTGGRELDGRTWDEYPVEERIANTATGRWD